MLATPRNLQYKNNDFRSATTYHVTGCNQQQETDTMIRGSYGTGFRAPSINQLFFPGFGNPNLQLEKRQGLDVAVDQTLFKERVTLSAGYFWTRYRNLILSLFDLTTCPAPFFFCAQNIGLARAEGVEVSAKFKLVEDQPWIRSLYLQLQYTYTSTTNLTNN